MKLYLTSVIFCFSFIVFSWVILTVSCLNFFIETLDPEYFLLLFYSFRFIVFFYNPFSNF